MSWIATAIVGGAVVASVASVSGAREINKGTDAATAEGRRQFDLTREDFAPFRESGVKALGRLDQLNEGDFSGFFTSPGFEFRRDEGLRGIENRFSASGGSLSGNALRRLTEFNSGLASQEFGNFFNRQLSQAGLGQTATTAGAQVGANISGGIQNALVAGGNARASGVTGLNTALQGGIANFITAKQAGFFKPKPTIPQRGVGGI